MTRANGIIVDEVDRYGGSQYNLAFARFGKMFLENDYGRKVVEMVYEPESFMLPGGMYKPDFRVLFEDGTVLFVEVKGSARQKGYRDARSKLRAAAELNKLYCWMEVRLKISKRTGDILDLQMEVIDA